VVWFALLCCVLGATVRYGVPWSYFLSGSAEFLEPGPGPKNPIVRLVTAEGWLLFGLVFFVPMAAGYLARGEWSVLPWLGFVRHARSWGLWDAVNTALMVIIADIWLFFGVAVYVARSEFMRMESERREWERESDGRDVKHVWLVKLETWRAKRKYYLIINVLAGLLLTTPYNPVYRLFDRLPTPELCSLPGLC
jgi:hypothetical protein